MIKCKARHRQDTVSLEEAWGYSKSESGLS